MKIRRGVMDLNTIKGNEYVVSPGQEAVGQPFTLDLDRESEKYAWRDLGLEGHYTEKSKATTMLITKTMGLLIMAGFRPILGAGNHDEIIFGYEQPVKSAGHPEYTTISVPIKGSMFNPNSFAALLANIDKTIGFNIKNPDESAPLEDRFAQLDEMLLNRFGPFNDVTSVYQPHGSVVYNAEYLDYMKHKYEAAAQAYVQEHPEEAAEIGTFEDSILHGNTDARILVEGKNPSLNLAIETRGVMSKITQAAMLSKPAISVYVNKREEDRNEDVDLTQFINARLENLSRKASKENMAQTRRAPLSPEEEELLKKYLPNKNLKNELTEGSSEK